MPRAALTRERINLDQFQNVARGGRAVGDDKIGVNGGNGRAAHARAFQPRLVNQLAGGKLRGRIFENATGARFLGLGTPAPLVEFLRPRGNEFPRGRPPSKVAPSAMHVLSIGQER